MRGSSWMVVVAVLALAGPADAQVEWEVDDETRWCEREWGDRDRERHCELREALLPAVDRLDVDGGTNGGVTVSGWDRDEVRVVAKVWARAPEMDRARSLARDIRVDVDDGRIRADGPRTGRREGWGVSYEIRVPRRTDLSLDTHNGGISVDGVVGSIDFDALNGGVYLADVAGDVRGRTTNGGLHIDLTGDTWEGRGLDVETTNGGVEIRVPEGYSAELETGTVNGGIEVDFPVTVRGRIDRRLTVSLGDGGPRIRAVTTNGGVTVERR